MISLSLSPRDKRTLAIGVIGIAVILFVGRILPVLYRWQASLREEAALVTSEARASEAAQRAQHTITTAAQEASEQYFALMPVFIPGETSASAATALASHVSDRANECGMRVTTMQTVVDSVARDRIPRVAIRAALAGDIQGVSQFLSILESGTPLIAIRSLSIVQAEPFAPENQPEALQIDLFIEALATPNETTDRNLALRQDTHDFTLPSWPALAHYDAARLSSAADSILHHNIFRLSRRPATIAFGTSPTPPPPQQPVPQVQLTLSGIVGGPPWKAILNGLPGREGGVIVAVGDTVSGYRIRAIRNQTVVVQGPDSTLTLGTKR